MFKRNEKQNFLVILIILVIMNTLVACKDTPVNGQVEDNTEQGSLINKENDLQAAERDEDQTNENDLVEDQEDESNLNHEKVDEENIIEEELINEVFSSLDFIRIYEGFNKEINIIAIDQAKGVIEEKYQIEVETFTGYQVLDDILYYDFSVENFPYLFNPITSQVFKYISKEQSIIKPLILQGKIEVMNYAEFVSSVQSNVEIILWEGNYDSSTYLNDTSNNEYVIIKDFNTIIQNVENLKIIGHEKYGKRIDFITDDPDATVLNFIECNHITLRNLKLSHAEVNKTCMGVTGWIKDSSNILIDSCDLYGSGRVGISINNSIGVQIRDSYIYDCSDYELFIFSSKDILFDHCIIEDIAQVDIHIIAAYNVTFLNSIIIEHNDTPKLKSEVGMFYYFFDSDIDLILGQGNLSLLYLNEESLEPFTDKAVNKSDWSEHPKLIQSWIGNKASYEAYETIKNHIELDDTILTRLHLSKDSDLTDLSHLEVGLKTDHNLDSDFLTTYLKLFYEGLEHELSDINFPIVFTFNNQVKVEIASEEALSLWNQSDTLLNDNIKITIIDYTFELEKMIVSDQPLMKQDAIQNIVDKYLIADGRFKVRNYDDGRYIDWQFEEILLDEDKVKYRFYMLFGTPFLGDLFHKDFFATIEIDPFTGQVHMLDNNSYTDPINVLADEYFDFFESQVYETNDLIYDPEHSIAFAIHEDTKGIDIIQVLYKDYDGEVYANPVMVHISKDNAGLIDFSTYAIDYENKLIIKTYD